MLQHPQSLKCHIDHDIHGIQDAIIIEVWWIARRYGGDGNRLKMPGDSVCGEVEKELLRES